MCDPIAHYLETVFIPAMITHAIVFALLAVAGVVFCIGCAISHHRKK